MARVVIGAHFRDPDHRYVSCDCCSTLGIRLEPVEMFNFVTHEVELVGVDLSPAEAYDHLIAVGWARSEVLDGDTRRIRDLCPRCQRVVVG